jgi:hypothetical protein
MIIYVAGSRDFSDKALLKRTLDAIHRERPVTTLIEGGNLGAHRFAYYWARSTGGIKLFRFEAKQREGEGIRAAERRSNTEALAAGVELVVAFPGGFRTRDMAGQAEAGGIEVRRVE